MITFDKAFIFTLAGMLCHGLFLFSQENTKIIASPTYDEIVKIYEDLDNRYKEARLLTYDLTDAGKPLQLFVISVDEDFEALSLRKKNKRIILVNNAIHAGEPDGIDASIKLVREILSGKNGWKEYLSNTVLCILPAYNIDGVLNRGSNSRANQNGPEEYGFRGNARNLDLNRDFIKCDSENAKSFSVLFHRWKPDVLVDTHVSNGADYQYTMTLIATQKDKLHPILSSFMQEKMLPDLYTGMKANSYEMTPYVNTVASIPDSGLTGFLETPRFSSGYASLFNTLAFITETHMLKPYPQRVMATYSFLGLVVKFVSRNALKIGEMRKAANEEVMNRKEFVLNWILDTTSFEKINFKGFKAAYKPSLVSGKSRLYYDRSSPYEKEIPYYNTFKSVLTVEKPYAYCIPQAWKEVVSRLELNKVNLKRLVKDTAYTVTAYYITSYETVKQPYEGHYLHSRVQVRKETQLIRFYKGDYVAFCNQENNRFVVETLEPQSSDSYFCWNFFDAILQQKEYFSDYVFEDLAADLLSKDKELKKKFEEKKANDRSFSESPSAQLNFIYRNSVYYEKSHNRYPVYRIENAMKLPVD